MRNHGGHQNQPCTTSWRWAAERFRLLPGGILCKGIVRGYTGALGLDQQRLDRALLRAYPRLRRWSIDDDRSWTAFASNVGKARMMRRDAMELRLRWVGAILLFLIVAAAAYVTVRYVGVASRLVVHHPAVHQTAAIHGLLSSAQHLVSRGISWGWPLIPNALH